MTKTMKKKNERENKKILRCEIMPKFCQKLFQIVLSPNQSNLVQKVCKNNLAIRSHFLAIQDSPAQ